TFFCLSISLCPPSLTLFPYTTLFRSRPVEQFPPPGVCPHPGPETPHSPVDRLPGYRPRAAAAGGQVRRCLASHPAQPGGTQGGRSEEHTSELQSRENLVCRLLLEKKN